MVGSGGWDGANNKDHENKTRLGRANNNMDVEPSTSGAKDVEFIVSRANNDIDAEIDASKLGGANNNNTQAQRFYNLLPAFNF